VTASVLPLLLPVPVGGGVGHEPRDRLELLTALTGGPGFDPLLRGEILTSPRDHLVWWWGRRVPDCERPRQANKTLCHGHQQQWQAARRMAVSRAEWIGQAAPLLLTVNPVPPWCLACPGRPTVTAVSRQLCMRHWHRLKEARAAAGPGLDLAAWLAGERPYPGYGECRVLACAGLAWSPLGLCYRHETAYRRRDGPGRRGCPPSGTAGSIGPAVRSPSATRTRPRSPQMPADPKDRLDIHAVRSAVMPLAALQADAVEGGGGVGGGTSAGAAPVRP
jgi:hypothetical protein